MIKLSPRLQIIYDMVPKCESVADVGCDHGYLTISLLEGGKVNRAIAMDVNKGPLESAKSNVKASGFDSEVCYRLSDGLTKLNPSEVNVICICGMGGALIKRILAAGMDVAKSVDMLIIEPQSEYKALRQFLMDSSFHILDEALCTEEGKIYPIMKIAYNPNLKPVYEEKELEYGPVILKNRPDLLSVLLDKNKREYTSILQKLDSKNNEADSPIQKRIDELTNKLELIRLIELEMED